MKQLQFLSVIIVLLTMTVSLTWAQQGVPLAKIRVDEDGNVQVVNLNENENKEDQKSMELNEKPYQETQPALSENGSLSNSASLPDLTYIGAKYTFTEPDLKIDIHVKNIGNSNADGNYVGFYLSDDKIITTGDKSLGTNVLQKLKPDEDVTVSLNKKIYLGDRNICGDSWYVGFIIDLYETVTESNEDNNTGFIGPPFEGGDCLFPDLIVTNIQITDSQGPEFGFSYTILNDGTVTTSFSFQNRIIFKSAGASSAVYTVSRPTCTEILDPGESYNSGPVTLIVTDVPSGQYYLGVDADGSDNDCYESNESNNETFNYVSQLTMPEGTDLSGTISSEFDNLGPDIKYGIWIHNFGNISITGSFNNKIYVSSDQTITSSDYLIDQVSCDQTLEPGDYFSLFPTLTISGVPAGNYYIGFRIDVNNDIDELDESNNTGYDNNPKIAIPGSPSTKPDLKVTEVSVTDQEGSQIDYQYSVKNGGSAGTGSTFKNYIYLSTDQTITQADYKIDEQQCSALGAGATHNSGTIQTTVSGVPAGEYYLGVYADGAQDIVESNENNNTGYNDSPQVSISEESGEPEEPEGNLISNWSFSDDMNDWQFATMNAGNATGTVENGVFNAQITNGGSNLWDVRIYQNDLSIESGNTYTGTFKAKAAGTKTIWASVGMITEPFITYNADWEFSLSSEWQTYTYTFTMGYFTDTETRMTFNLGTSSENVYLDNISLVDETPEGPEVPEQPQEPEEPAGNMISNWSFNNGLNDWTFNTAESGNAQGKVENGVFHAQITNGGVNTWNVSLYHYNLNIIKGNTYTVSFDARADSPRDILTAVAMSVSPFWLYNFEPQFSLTTEWQTYTYTFIMGFDTDPAARLGFDFGTSDADVYLDRISCVEIASATDIETPEPSTLVKSFKLYQNFPNPFNPITTIRFQIPEYCFVSLKVYDLLGKEVDTLVQEEMAAGMYNIEWNGKDLPSGIYIYQLVAGTITETRKLVLQK